MRQRILHVILELVNDARDFDAVAHALDEGVVDGFAAVEGHSRAIEIAKTTRGGMSAERMNSTIFAGVGSMPASRMSSAA